MYKTMPWNNFTRCHSYDLSPFDKTLVLDTDFLVGNNLLLKCFSNNNFKISSSFIDLNPSVIMKAIGGLFHELVLGKKDSLTEKEFELMISNLILSKAKH